MKNLLDILVYISEGFVIAGATLALVCMIAGGYFFWKVFCHSLYIWRLTLKWNMFHKMPQPAKDEALLTKDFSIENDLDKAR